METIFWMALVGAWFVVALFVGILMLKQELYCRLAVGVSRCVVQTALFDSTNRGTDGSGGQ